MGDPRRLRPDEVEILVARELRKAGLEVSGLRVRGRTALSEDQGEYAVEITGVVRVDDADRRVLVECRNERQPVGPESVLALDAKLADAGARHALLFSTSGYAPDAVRRARERGIPLLAVADGRAAFARSPWSTGGQPPAWVPEYMAEVVDLDATGELRHHLVVADRPRLILDRLASNT